MTPCNIAGMAKLNGLDIVALTDHNSTGNCRSFCAACKEYGIVPVPGMELTTCEDIHMVCLFPTVEDAESFGKAYLPHRIPYKNREDIFGKQIYYNENDEISGYEENLLINASDMSVDDAYALVSEHNGAAFPAHINKEENGIIPILGALPEKPFFGTVEYKGGMPSDEYKKKYGLENKHILYDSDAHYLYDIAAAEHKITLECGKSEQEIRTALIELIKGK